MTGHGLRYFEDNVLGTTGGGGQPGWPVMRATAINFLLAWPRTR